ncbi:MAG: 4-hydroxy-3-methylbut-2-enyl diphosphate reductase [Spirochaetaceae bacterium]|jgi:4-hydroxy-3-methylbut-2-enyl diphosphate reductase|nr:4-hydroxy-3-methylbut-2-enyl diphosphate reductase [Spirochaetaceae bacterium]
MKVLRAKVLGFCMGVRRAVEMTEAELAGPEQVYTMGPLIHNPQTLAFLADRGVRILDEADLEKPGRDFRNGAVIIRAHGISPGVEKKLLLRGDRDGRKKSAFRIVDATCPRVKASQLAARSLAERGYLIFLAGERDHAEIQGIYGYVLTGKNGGLGDIRGGALGRDSGKAVGETGKVPAGETFPPCIIVGSPEEAEAAARTALNGAPENFPVKTALIGQTTISEAEYSDIAAALTKSFPNLEVQRTICGATRDRQNALRELCSLADALVIAGGRNSANTRRLLSIARECGKPAWLAESAADLPAEAGAYPVVGLSAGASTPDSVIDEIERALLYLNKVKEHA